MNLYFLRHGLAEEREVWEGSDFDRPLTKKGKDRMKRSAEKIAELELGLDTVITSPLKRAYETAEIVADQLEDCRLKEDQRLGPGFNAAMLERILGEYSDAEALMLVGHEPDFSQTIEELTGGRVVCKKGSLARVDLIFDTNLRLDQFNAEESQNETDQQSEVAQSPAERPAEGGQLQGELVWLIPPKVLAL